MKSDMSKGILCAVCSALIFGITPVLASITFEMGSNALTLTFYRNVMAVPVLLIILLVRKVNLRITLKELLTLTVISVLFSVTTTYILYDAYNYIGVGLSTTLHFLYPMFTVLLGFLLFKKKLGREKVLALILATVGRSRNRLDLQHVGTGIRRDCRRGFSGRRSAAAQAGKLCDYPGSGNDSYPKGP